MANYKQHAEKMTRMVLDMLEKGEAPPWQKPWVGALGPRNPVSGIEHSGNGQYKGGNPLYLSLVALVNGWTSKYWSTRKQITAHGGRTEGRSTPVLFWSRFQKKDKETGEEKWITVSRVFYVYNYSQLVERGDLDDVVKRYEAKYLPKAKGAGTLAEAEAVLENLPETPHFVDGGGRAWYQFRTDEIGLPDKSAFTGTEEWYTTVWHELVHWTGHESRLQRDLGNWFGSPAYSFEELVAEIATATLAGLLGFSDTVIENSAAYVRGWLKSLKDNPTWLPKALTQAVYALEFMLEGKKPKFLVEEAN